MTPTREQIIQWAREAGGTNYRNRHVETTAIGFMPDALERFAQAVRAAELRRLHEENEKFKEANITLMERIGRRDARIAALEQAGRMAQETLQAEIERLNKALTYEQHRAERIGTHGPGCEMWGPQHYECAARKLKEQQDAMARVLEARDRYGWSMEADVEIEAMREQLNRES